MTDTIETRVARGVALFDEREPGWWRADRQFPIFLEILDLKDTCDCVLGQTWNGGNGSNPFAAHAKALFGEGDDAPRLAIEHGFDSKSFAFEYDALGAEWKRVIEARRSAS